MLNREDPEWFWIVRSDGQEGFIPSGFVYPADNILQTNGKQSTNAYNAIVNQQNDSRQPQHQIADVIVNNDSNTCQNLNLQHGTTIGHVSIQNNNNNAINDQTIMNNNSNNTNSQVQPSQQQQQQSIVGGSEDLRYHGTELVMLYDYKVDFVYFEAFLKDFPIDFLVSRS